MDEELKYENTVMKSALDYLLDFSEGIVVKYEDEFHVVWRNPSNERIEIGVLNAAPKTEEDGAQLEEGVTIFLNPTYEA